MSNLIKTLFVGGVADGVRADVTDGVNFYKWPHQVQLCVDRVIDTRPITYHVDLYKRETLVDAGRERFSVMFHKTDKGLIETLLDGYSPDNKKPPLGG